MKKILLFIIGILIIILENTVINYIDLFDVSFNIVIVYVTIIALYLDELEISIIAALLGMIIDITVGGIFGINALILFVVAYGISYLRHKIYKENYITIFTLVFITSVFDAILNIGLVGQIYVVNTLGYRIIRGILVYPFINALIGVLIYMMANKSIVKLKES